MNSTIVMTLPLFCCIEKQLASVAKLETVGQIVTLTQPCFTDKLVSLGARLKLILDIRSYANVFLKSECEALHIETLCSAEPRPEFVAYFAFWLVVFFVASLGNIAVLFAIYRSRQLRSTVTNFFIGSLAVSDLLVALSIVPVKLKFSYDNLHFCASDSMCRLYQSLDPIFFAASITNLLVIAVDRFIALVWPYAYPSLLTTRRARVVIICVWGYAVIWGGLVNVKWENTLQNAVYRTSELECVVNNRVYTSALFGFVFYIPAVVMAFIYYHIFLIARRHAKNIAATEIALRPGKNRPSSFSQNNNLEESVAVTQTTPTTSRTGSKTCSNRDSVDQSPVSTMTRNDSSAYLHRKKVISKPSMSARSLSKRRMFRVTKTVATVYGMFLICWLPVSVISLLRSWCSDCLHQSTTWKWLHIVFVDILPVFNSVCNPFIYAIMSKTYRAAFVGIWKSIRGKFLQFELPKNYDCGKTVVSTSV